MSTTEPIDDIKRALGLDSLDQRLKSIEDKLDALATAPKPKTTSQVQRITALEEMVAAQATALQSLTDKVELYGDTAGSAQQGAWKAEAERLEALFNASHTELAGEISTIKVELDSVKSTVATHGTRLDAIDGTDGSIAKLATRMGLVADGTELAHKRIDTVEKKVDAVADREVPMWAFAVGAVAALITFLVLNAADFTRVVGEGEAAQEVTNVADEFWFVLLVSVGVGLIVFGFIAMFSLFQKPNGYDEATPPPASNDQQQNQPPADQNGQQQSNGTPAPAAT